MKRLLSAMLTMLLVITALCPAAIATAAETRNINITFKQGLYLEMIASTDDTVYALLHDSSTNNCEIHMWKAGMDESMPLITEVLTMYANDEQGEDRTATNIVKIFVNDNELYGYHDESFSVRKLIDADGNPTSTDILYYIGSEEEAQSDNEYPLYFDEVLAKDDVLYAGMSINKDNRDYKRVTCFDIKTGDVISQADLPLTRYYAPIGNNKLLLVQADYENAYNAETGMYEPAGLVIRDMVTGESEGIGYTKDPYDSCVSYLAENNTIYFASGTSVYAYKDMTGDYQRSAYMPSYMYRDSYGAALEGGLFAIKTNNNMIAIRELDSPELSGGALTLFGDLDGEEHYAFITAHPQVAITRADIRYRGINDYYTMMISGDTTIDIMNFISTITPIGKLIQKGYAADLSGYPELMALTASMPSAVKDVIMKDDKLYGVPALAETEGYAYINETLNLLDLTPDDMPKTFVELLEFMANFQENYGESHPEVKLFENMDMRESLMNDIISLYTANQLRAGEVVTMDTPLFRKLMAAYEKIDFAEIDPHEQYGEEIWNNDALLSEFYESPTLLSDNTQFNDPTAYSSNAYYTPLILPLDEGLEPIGEMIMTIMVVNPHSTRKDIAALYMAEYIKNYGIQNSYAFDSTNNQPIENPDYEAMVQEIQNDIDVLEKRLATANPEEKAGIEGTLERSKESLSESDAWKMLVSQDAIKAFREKASPYFYVTPITPISDRSGDSAQELSTLKSQYLYKAITLDQYIQEMDNRLTMMRLED
ncbi:MAG: hypothetical protein GX096_01445 [Clostridiales bacterium]|nr:hypothetical protein [Clostridiales bacterium]